MELPYNKEIQFYPINKMCMLDTCALSAGLVFKLDAIKKIK